jgi:cytochrome c553
VSQLQAWKTGARTNDPQKLMKTVAEKLTDDDIHAVADYLATLGTREKGNE